MKIVNERAYQIRGKKVRLVVEAVLDPVPGAWHEPEDLARWICQHNYVQSVEEV